MRRSRWAGAGLACTAWLMPVAAYGSVPATGSASAAVAAPAPAVPATVATSGFRRLTAAERGALTPGSVHGTCHRGDGTTRLWARIGYTVPAGTATSFYSAMTFCWNRSTVTYAAATVTGTVTSGAAGAGWTYLGSTDNEQFGYRWGGHDGGGFADRQTGHFRYCPVSSTTCTDYYPWIHLYGHYDGSYSLSHS